MAGLAMQDQDQIDRDKSALRETLKRRRAAIDAAGAGAAVARFAGDVLALALPVAEPVISLYMPIGSELDPGPLLVELEKLGAQGALPVIAAKDQPLVFRAYTSGDELDEKRWGIREPMVERRIVCPDILILPLLGFDDAGWRIGYGGGFYDRTLAQLRAQKTVVAVGLAFDEQRVDGVVHGAYDEPLDCVLTPTGLKKFQR